MKQFKTILILALMGASLNSCAQAEMKQSEKRKINPYYSHTDTKPLNVKNSEWKKLLSEGEYQVAREEVTERAYTGEFWETHKEGTYYCGACGNKLFVSETKFESGTGWPSFYQPAANTSLKEKTDPDGQRTEVECERCGAHLGHVFNDGPQPTGLRYCINSAILDFEAK